MSVKIQLNLLVFSRLQWPYEQPLIDAKTFEKLFLYLGFKIMRQKGSHVFYRHEDGRYTTLPHHSDQDLGRSLIRAILRQIELSPEEFIELLEQI